jgi:hypothetical protein
LIIVNVCICVYTYIYMYINIYIYVYMITCTYVRIYAQDLLHTDVLTDGLEKDLERTIELLQMYDSMKSLTEKGALVLLKVTMMCSHCIQDFVSITYIWLAIFIFHKCHRSKEIM